MLLKKGAMPSARIADLMLDDQHTNRHFRLHQSPFSKRILAIAWALNDLAEKTSLFSQK